MNAVLTYLKNLWAQEPVKVAGYGAVTALFAVLVAKGVLDNDVSDYILSLVAVLIGIPGTAKLAKLTVAAPKPASKRQVGK